MTASIGVQLTGNGEALVRAMGGSLRTVTQQAKEAAREIAGSTAGAIELGFSDGLRGVEREFRANIKTLSDLSRSASLTNGVVQFDRSGQDAALRSARDELAIQRQLSAALNAVAAERGQDGAALRVQAAATASAVQRAEEHVRALEQQAALLDRVQDELGQTAVQQRRANAVNGEARQGAQQLSYNLADIASGWAAGIPPMQIFAQQGTQVVQAIQLMTTRSSGLIGVLAGPWGLALTSAVTVLGSYIWSLRESADVTEKATLASDGLSSAQSVLGQMFDLTTGKIKAQNELLRLNIQLTAIQLRADAMKAEKEAQDAERAAGQRSWSGWFTAKRPGALTEVHDTVARRKLQGVMRGELDASEVAKWAEKADFSGVNLSNKEYLEALARVVEVRRNRALAGKIDESVENKVLDPIFRREDRSGRKGGGKSADPAKAAEAMAGKLDEAYEKAVQLRGQFDAMPSDIDKANNALIDAQQLIAQAQKTLADPKATAENKKRADEVLRVATEAQRLAEAAPGKPMTDQLAQMQQAIEGQRILASGRMAEYNTLQDNVELARVLGATELAQIPAMIEKRKISQAQLDAFYAQRQELRLQTIELQRHQREQQKLLQVVEGIEGATKSAIYDFYDGKGLGAAKSFFKSAFDIQKQVMTEDAFKFLFGNGFENQKNKILGLDRVDEAGKYLAKSINSTRIAIEQLGETAARVAGIPVSGAANDNIPIGQSPNDIVATAQRTMQQEMRDALKTLGDKILGPKFSGQIGQAFQTAMQGAAAGQAASGVLRSLGVGQSNTGAAIGGAIGNAILPGIGGFIGGALGGTIGGLFKKTPKGSATISNITEDAVYSGSGKLRDSVSALADGVQGSLSQIAEALGADVGSFRVSIGQRKKKFVVDPTGGGRTKGSGVLKFDSEEEAVMAALRDALADGAIRGISAASQRILRAGKDVQAALEKAVLIESIPKLLKSRLNPVAAALDELNDKWDRTVAALREGAASAEQFADAEKLYALERDEIMKAANDNLKTFLNGLNFGPNSGLSLRDQTAAAQAQVQPYLDQIASGQIAGIDRDKYLEAADAFLQLSRSLNGSGSAYFDTVDQLRQSTQSLLDQSVAGAEDAEARDPFGRQTAQSTQAMANILDGHTELLTRQNQLLQQMASRMGVVGDFIGADRLFVVGG